MFLIASIGGCASKDKKGDRGSEKSSTEKSSPDAGGDRGGSESPGKANDSRGHGGTEPSGMPGETTPQYPEAKKESNALAQAIASKNEESIFRAATQTLSVNPNDIRALNALGVYYFNRSKLVAAEYFYSKAQKIQQTSEVFNNIALIQLANGEKREAIKTLRKALDLNSNDGVTAANLGAIYVQEKDYAKAKFVLENAVKRGTKDFKILVNYGVAQAATGNLDSAKLLYEEAIKINSSSAEATLNYAILLIEHMNLKQEGMQQLDKLRFMGGDSNIRNKMTELENKARAETKPDQKSEPKN